MSIDRRDFLGGMAALPAVLFLSSCYSTSSLESRRLLNAPESVPGKFLNEMQIGTVFIRLGCKPFEAAIANGAGFIYSNKVIVTTAHGFDSGFQCVEKVVGLDVDQQNILKPRTFFEDANKANSDNHVIVRDEKEDLAILYFKMPLLNVDSKILQVSDRPPYSGEPIAACGHPYDHETQWIVTEGRAVSYIEDVTAFTNGPARYLRNRTYRVTGTNFQDGNSGGPVIDSQGRVIGLAAGSSSMLGDRFDVVVPIDNFKIERLIVRALTQIN